MFLQVFHLSVFALNTFTLWYDQMYVDLPFPSKEIEQLPLKARHLFLTVWCLVIQALYFAISFLNDVNGTNAVAPKNPPFIRRTKDVVFSLAFPVAIYVSTAFWGLYTINKDFILPDEIAIHMPVWVNHVMHTFIVPFICIELLVTRRNYPTRKFGTNMMFIFMLAYVLCVFTIFLKTGMWVYPFLEMFNWPMRITFCFSSVIGGIGFYILGEKINNAVSPNQKAYANGVNGKHKN